jgi:hypothetical protein
MESRFGKERFYKIAGLKKEFIRKSGDPKKRKNIQEWKNEVYEMIENKKGSLLSSQYYSLRKWVSNIK